MLIQSLVILKFLSGWNSERLMGSRKKKFTVSDGRNKGRQARVILGKQFQKAACQLASFHQFIPRANHILS